MDDKYQNALDTIRNINPNDLAYNYDDCIGCEVFDVEEVYGEEINTLQELINDYVALQKENKIVHEANQNWKVSFEHLSSQFEKLKHEKEELRHQNFQIQKQIQKSDNYYGLMVQANQNYQDILYENQVLEKALELASGKLSTYFSKEEVKEIFIKKAKEELKGEQNG